jgi:signal transduction histidine kinase
MLDTNLSPKTFWQLWTGRLGVFIVVITQLVAIGVMVASVVFAQQYSRLPFIGSLVEHTLAFNTAGPQGSPAWEIHNLNLPFGYRLLALDGQELQNTSQLYLLLEQQQVGDRVEVSVADPDGQSIDYTVILQQFPLSDLFSLFLIPWLTGLLYLASSLWVFGFRRRDAAGQAFSIFTASVAVLLMGLFDLFTTNRMTVLWTVSLALLGGSLCSLGMVFPAEIPFVKNRPVLRWIWFVPSITIFLATFPTLYNYKSPLRYASMWRLGYLYCGFAFVLFIFLLFYQRRVSQSAIVKEQTRLILWGSAAAFTPISLWFIFSVIWPLVNFKPFLIVPVAIFPAVIAYTLARYRLLQADFLFNRILAYGTMTLVAAIGYALLVAGFSLVFGGIFDISNPYVIGGIIFILAFLFTPMRSRVQAAVDTIFNRGSRTYRERLQAFGHELTMAMEMPAILNLLRRYIDEPLVPFHLHIYIHDPLSKLYEAAPDADGVRTSDLRFTADSALVENLSNRRKSIFLGDVRTLPANLQPERSRISLLGSQVFVPLPGRKELTGWVALGPRRSGEPLTNQDLEYVESLCDQVALAIERAQVVTDLEHRVQALNVLTRISQGINVTLAFDDILELIYAQTNQLIPSKDFRITLFDPFGKYLYPVFWLEDDERLSEQENQPVPFSQGLEQEVLDNRRILLTEDYERECRSKGMLPNMPNVLSWMGVPLNAGAETIGVISLGSRDATTIYTSEQADLVQAIADQAAGAIVKARLLQEAERRARQLTILNEVSRSMTSTLELVPLLNQILQSAVDILNCEAGSLLLIDDQTGELVFEVALGPVGKELIGQRLPPGTGLSGKAVETRQPIIVNDVRRMKEWSEKQDEQTGFTTTDLLVVPMVYKDTVTGVIEVINRNDKLPFTTDDQELLAAFSSQAAVAFENARLYTTTDQSLAERVEELSVMQRIDRELNASLDVNRAMRITLEWAMRQADSYAGLIGIVEEDGVRVMASQGYTNELSGYEESLLPESLAPIHASITTGQVQIAYSRDGVESDAIYLLNGAKAQAVIPLRREETVIGILLLENRLPEGYSEDVLAFLSRLCDHASIAITNARLYAEVQLANQAKTDFVSFVSHELKTPMTSIRGFTDLLASGVVGPINPNQSNFLSTIRSNVDRMATLVNDLTDVSRIEAGRLRLDFGVVPVEEMVEEVVRSTRAQIEEKHQVLDLKIAPDLPAVWGDRTRLIQVMTNLVSNAYKYTPQEGKITIQAESSPNIWKLGGPKVIQISVTDTGYGISPENQSKIFQKFFRSDDQKVRDAPGTGLGLNITKQLVELQGGSIWFESEFRVGSTFHFTVPIAEAV